MNRTVKTMGWAALVPVAVIGARYAWKAFSPAIAESMPVENVASVMQERMDALRTRLERSGATKAAEKMLRHEKKALKHVRAGEMHKWQAIKAGVAGSPMINAISDKAGGLGSSVAGWQARRDVGKAKKHKAAAIQASAEAVRRKWQAIGSWLSETGDVLEGKAGELRTVAASERLQDAGKRAKTVWSEYGWGAARAQREATKRRNHIALGLAAGLSLGAGAVYLLLRRENGPGAYSAGQAQHMYYTGNGATTGLQDSQRSADQAMRQTEASFDNTTAVSGNLPAREMGMESRVQSGDVQPTAEEAWIVIPKEQWAEFIQRMSDSHQGWTVRVESEGGLSMDKTPVEGDRFSGMQLEPSMARPGVRMLIGRLPREFFEHVIPDLRSVEHLPSDEEGFQGVRLTTTVDRVTIRFTDPGEATDELYRGE
jgi:hypothetical protein